MNAVITRKRSAIAAAIAFAAVITAGGAFAESGNLSSGNPDVNKVFGRASISPVSGTSIKTGGLSNQTLGRSGGSGKRALAQNVVSRPVDGALQLAGRGSQPIYAARTKGVHAARVTAKAQ